MCSRPQGLTICVNHPKKGTMMKTSLALCGALLLSSACIAPQGTPWEEAIVATQDFAESVTADEVFPFVDTQADLDALTALLAQGASACLELTSNYGGATLDAKRRSFGSKLGSFAKGVAQVGLAAIGPAH